jgi:hypothetical protein
MASLARLNFNQTKLMKWKGNVLFQNTSAFKKNGLTLNPSENTSDKQLQNHFRALPLKIYRREIAMPGSDNVLTSISRASQSIDELARPGGSFISEKTCTEIRGGLVNIIEDPKPNSKYETYSCSNPVEPAVCVANNAKRRCRSSGNIKRVYDPARQDLTYFTNSNQYLVSRSKTFNQNQYHHVRKPDYSLISNTKTTTYAPNGISHCPKTLVHSGTSFKYHWINTASDSSFNVIIPESKYYDVQDLNAVFESTMIANGHYLIYKPTSSKVLLMKIIYNNETQSVEIQSFSSAFFNGNSNYEIPTNQSWDLPPGEVPYFIIPSNPINNLIGFSAGNYPAANANERDSAIGFLSNIPNSLHPSNTIMHYKPSNSRFAVQGAVSSGDMIQRRKFETITNNGKTYTEAYGSQVGNAMSYGVLNQAYTIKDKIGFPLTKTPVIDKYTGELRCRTNGRLCAPFP